MTTSDESTTDGSPQQARLSEPELTPEQLAVIKEADDYFDQMCAARHNTGRTKYGVLTFIEMPTLEMALEEIADLANYARYTFIKVALLRHNIKQAQKESLGTVEGFFPNNEILKATKEME